MEHLTKQYRLVAALARLTQLGKARWARRPVEPEFAFCLAGDDLVRFELSQGQEQFDPSEPVHGIHGILGNIHFLWLEGVGGWDELLPLIQAAPFNDDECAAIHREAEASVLRRVEALQPTTDRE
jgi:hypothetical protein